MIKVEYNDYEIKYYFNGKVIYSANSEESDYDLFINWIEGYNKLVRDYQYEGLDKIGQEMYKWLNRNNNFENIKPVNSNPLLVEFEIQLNGSASENAFIEAPWELLADEKGFFAETTGYSPVRRIGATGEKREPSEYKLNTLFMAASPRNNQKELDFEAEERSMLNIQADEAIDMTLFVEESGELNHLVRKLKEFSPVDVLHISCHGNIVETKEGKKNPVILLEDEYGEEKITGIDGFKDAFTQNLPPLLFLSACRTSEAYEISNKNNKGGKEENDYLSFSHSLVRKGFPALLGWSGSVSDKEATKFAGEFYTKLANGDSIEHAFACARKSLFLIEKGEISREKSKYWHLARLYLGSPGGGVLAGTKDKYYIDFESGAKEFFGKKGKGLEVAGRKDFVGRRRQIQDILREFNKSFYKGIIIHGIGRQGKSSLAARVANRMTDHETILIFGRKGEERFYLARNILNEFKSISSVATELEEEINRLAESVDSNPWNLKPALKRLLSGPFSGVGENGKKILLVIDDLEKILIDPVETGRLHTVKEDFKPALASVIKAFKEARTNSRLLITSRFRFELEDVDGKNVPEDLYHISLPAMNDTEARKQYMAKYGKMDYENFNPDAVVKVCRGNPGLQDLLFTILNNSPEKYRQIIEEMAGYLERGVLPEEQEVQSFLEELAVKKIINLTSKTEKELLKIAGLFEIPLPVEIFKKLAELTGLPADTNYMERLTGFGILEVYDDFVLNNTKALLLNFLFRPLLSKISEEDIKFISPFIADSLYDIWYNKNNYENNHWIAGRELLKFALIAEKGNIISRIAEITLLGMFNNMLAREATFMAAESLRIVEQQGMSVPAGFYHISAEIFVRTGNIELAYKLLKKSLNMEGLSKFEEARSHLYLGRIEIQRGEIKKGENELSEAEKIFKGMHAERELAVTMGDIARIRLSQGEVEEALKLHETRMEVFEKLGDTRSKAVTMGDIARIRLSQGEVEEALKLHNEEMKVYEKLGDTRSKAVTMGDIARIRLSQGEVEEALKLHETMMEVFEKLGDTRSKAVTMGDIARIRLSQGEVEEALKLHETMMEVFEKLGDTRSKAVTMGDIARIRLSQGEVEEALKLHNEEMKVYEKLGDTRSKAVTMGDIARIRLSQGEVEEALKLHETRMEVFEKLGDTRSKAVTMGDIARIRLSQGEVEEALKLHNEEMKVYEKLGDTRSKAVTMGDIARIRLSQGEVEEALKLHETRMEVFEKLGDTRSKAVTMGDIARIRLSQGEVEEALKLHNEEMKVYEKLGDTRSKAVTMGDIARIRLSQGEVEEALKLHETRMEVFEKLGDTRSKAVTMGDIARIRLSQGEVEEALKLHETRMEVFEKLGDTRSKAVTMGDIARIRLSQGEVEEALKLHETMMEVFEKLGDTRSKAVTMGDIARIRLSQGEVEEALKLHETMMEVFEKLGDTRSKAVTMGDIARIRLSQGEVEEALKLHETMMEVFEKLGDTRSKAVTMGDIARIRLSQGEVEEALKLHETMMEVFEKLGDTRSKAVTMGDIARIRLSQGEVEEALKLHETRMEVFEKLGDTREKAVTMGDIARIRLSQGEVEEALKLHETMMEVFEKLGDNDGIANVLWNRGKIKLGKKEFNEAFESFATSYSINLKLGRLDGISFVGFDLGLFLCQAGNKKEGLDILKRSYEGFIKLKQNVMAEQTKEAINYFGGEINNHVVEE